MKPDNSKKLRMQTLLSILTMVVGILLLAMKIYVDSEPGAIPLLLIVVGAVMLSLQTNSNAAAGPD